MRDTGYTKGIKIIVKAAGTVTVKRTSTEATVLVSLVACLSKQSHVRMTTQDKTQAPTTPKDAVLHNIFSTNEGKVKLHARQWTAPNNAPAIEAVLSRGWTPASSLYNIVENDSSSASTLNPRGKI